MAVCQEYKEVCEMLERLEQECERYAKKMILAEEELAVTIMERDQADLEVQRLERLVLELKEQLIAIQVGKCEKKY